MVFLSTPKQTRNYCPNNRMAEFPSPLICIERAAANRYNYTVNRQGVKVSGPKREDVRGEWRRLRNEELYYL